MVIGLPTKPSLTYNQSSDSIEEKSYFLFNVFICIIANSAELIKVVAESEGRKRNHHIFLGVSGKPVFSRRYIQIHPLLYGGVNLEQAKGICQILFLGQSFASPRI